MNAIQNALSVLKARTVQGKFNAANDLAKTWDTFQNIGSPIDNPPHNPGRPAKPKLCLLYTSPSPRDGLLSRMPSSA